VDNYCGKRLDGRYEIKEIIGVGGMAVVYKAYDNIDDRIVAIKILKQELLENEEFRRRFKNESKAIAVLSHPNIVKVYDVSFGDRLQYIVMEYIEGITLKEYIEQQGVINWKDAVHFLTQILKALQHAHDKGIIHRDIKPQNIMLLSNGTIKVTDFGIARFSRGDSNTLTENSAIGSVHYISPEQARGEVTDDKADIYSVGVVMYEMLTGQLPFQSDSAVSVAIMQVQQEAKHPREINPDIPLGLEQITLRAMQKNTRDRYHSAAEMLMDLDEFKKNPSIKFDYSYFVDKDPTKYVGSQRAAAPVKIDEEEEDEAEDNTDRKKALAIVGGIAAGLTVLALIIALIVGLSGRVEVPNFVGMNYNEEIYEKDAYAGFNFQTQNVYDAEKDVGTVLEQTPAAGSKIKKSKPIVLKIAYNDETVVIEGIVNKTAEEAKELLVSKGFKVEIVEVFDKEKTPGLVFKTFPEEGNYADKGSTVTIYVATDSAENAVKVPQVTDYSLDIAKVLIEKVGLKCEVKEVNSTKDKGMVVSQSPVADTAVDEGSTVVISVSNGIPESSTASVTFTLPSGVGVSGTIKYYLNDSLYKTENDVLFSGKSKSFEVTGSGKDNTFVITANDKKIFECKIDFTKIPGVVSDTQRYDYSEEVALPDNIIGEMKEVAENRLKNAGFNNISFAEQASDTVEAGRVISTEPSGGAGSKYPVNTHITVYISSGPEKADNQPDSNG
jgi:serine/threonine-protein kinase